MEGRVRAIEYAMGLLQQENIRLQAALDEQRRMTVEREAAEAMRPKAERLNSLVDTRLIGKHRNFAGKEEDWPSWSTTVRAYTGAVSERLLLIMDEAEGEERLPTNLTLSADGDRGLSTQLYYILTMLLEGNVSEKVNLVGRGQGLLLWRSLTDEYAGKAVENSGTAIAFCCKDGIIFATDLKGVHQPPLASLLL